MFRKSRLGASTSTVLGWHGASSLPRADQAVAQGLAVLALNPYRLNAACDNADQGACMELQRMATAEHFREANRFRSEHHMRRQ